MIDFYDRFLKRLFIYSFMYLFIYFVIDKD